LLLFVSSVFLCFVKQAHTHTPRGSLARERLCVRFSDRGSNTDASPLFTKLQRGRWTSSLPSFLFSLSLSNKERRDGGEERVRSFCVCSKRLSISSPLHLFGIIFFCDPIAGLQIPGCHTHAHTHRSCICKCIYLVQRAHARKKKSTAQSHLSSLRAYCKCCAHLSLSSRF
jgi:hypothetical protein